MCTAVRDYLWRDDVEEQPSELGTLRELCRVPGDEVVHVREGVLRLGILVELLLDLLEFQMEKAGMVCVQQIDKRVMFVGTCTGT